jgi:hypothetical protein
VVAKGDVVAYLGLVNPLATPQSATVELIPEGGSAVSFVVTLAPTSRRGVDLTNRLPPNAAFGTLVHFDAQGLASLTLRRVADFFGASALSVPGQQFCREAR